MSTSSEPTSPGAASAASPHYYRFHLSHVHLASTFGDGLFALKAEADAQHREDLASAAEQRQTLASKQTEQLLNLLRQNTELTVLVRNLSQRIEAMTVAMHAKVVEGDKPG